MRRRIEPCSCMLTRSQGHNPATIQILLLQPLLSFSLRGHEYFFETLKTRSYIDGLLVIFFYVDTLSF